MTLNASATPSGVLDELQPTLWLRVAKTENLQSTLCYTRRRVTFHMDVVGRSTSEAYDLAERFNGLYSSWFESPDSHGIDSDEWSVDTVIPEIAEGPKALPLAPDAAETAVGMRLAWAMDHVIQSS